MKRASFSGALLISAALGSASVQASEAVRLEYRAPAECPSEPVFVGRVRERSVHQRAAAPTELARSFLVTVTADEGGFLARVDFVDADGTAISRSVRGETCDEVVSGIALVTALAIDARAVTPTAAPAAPASASVAPPLAKPAPPPPPAPPSREPPLRFRAGLGAGFSSYAGPSGALSLDVFFAASLDGGGPSARLSAFHLRSSVPDPSGREGRLRIYAGRLEGCPLSLGFSPFFFEPCAGTDLGVLFSSGVPSEKLPKTDDQAQVWWDAVVLGRLGFVLGESVVLEAQGELGIPFVRPSFGFDGDSENPVFEVPPVGGSVRGGIGIRFP